jgi:hypothetical protein
LDEVEQLRQRIVELEQGNDELRAQVDSSQKRARKLKRMYMLSALGERPGCILGLFLGLLSTIIGKF